MKTTASCWRALAAGCSVEDMMDSFVFVTYRRIIVNKHHQPNLHSRSNRPCEWSRGPQSHFPHCCSLQTTVRLSSKGWWVPAGRHLDSEPPQAHHSSIPTSSQFPSNNMFPNKQDQLSCPTKGARPGHGPAHPSNTMRGKHILDWLLYTKNERSNSVGFLCSSFWNRRHHHLSHCVTTS